MSGPTFNVETHALAGQLGAAPSPYMSVLMDTALGFAIKNPHEIPLLKYSPNSWKQHKIPQMQSMLLSGFVFRTVSDTLF